MRQSQAVPFHSSRDCEPLLHDGGVANDSEEETQVVSVHQAPGNSVTRGGLQYL